MAARKRASAQPSPPQTLDTNTTTGIVPLIASPKKALIFKFCVFFSIPYFYLLYQHYNIEQDLRRSILINAALCVAGFFLTQRMIPVASRYVSKRGLFGFDINKKGTPQGEVKVPESLGIVVGIVFLVLAILFQYFNFTADSNASVTFPRCFMLLFCILFVLHFAFVQLYFTISANSF